MELKLNKKTAKALYPESPQWFQKVLIETFGEDYFKKRDFTEIKTFADACEECGTTEEEFNERFANFGLDIDTINYEKAKIVVKAINQGWTPDWSNSSQYKYWPYFKLSSGFGFSASAFNYDYSLTSVGSHLCFETKEKCTYAAQQFIDIYEQFLTIKK